MPSEKPKFKIGDIIKKDKEDDAYILVGLIRTNNLFTYLGVKYTYITGDLTDTGIIVDLNSDKKYIEIEFILEKEIKFLGSCKIQ